MVETIGQLSYILLSLFSNNRLFTATLCLVCFNVFLTSFVMLLIIHILEGMRIDNTFICYA